MNFGQALPLVLAHEGGFADHHEDPGGATNYGISKRTARDHGYDGDMRDIPMALVATIYRRSYWDACRCDELPLSVRFDVFDGAVNSGVGRSIRWLQTASGASVDGIIGPETLRMAHDTANLRARYNGQRLAFLASLEHFVTFGRGWVRRVADNLKREDKP